MPVSPLSRSGVGRADRAIEIGVLPSGQLHCYSVSAQNETTVADPASDIERAFARSIGDGLFALAARRSDSELSASFVYWRMLAREYLRARCHVADTQPEQPNPIEPLNEAQTTDFLLSAPPMRGGEYLSARTLQQTWDLLDDWVCSQIRSHDGLAGFLQERAPQWHQVGRVCFHLAENKIDPQYPFAFMVTYASALSSQGRVRHLPLGKALQEYAGASNKKALIQLLSPVQRASEASSLVRDLLETGDLYHPLAWTPPEAYAFLKEIPLYEQSGVIVRLPDWWKKRPRPRVGVTIGTQQRRFGTDALLDFKLKIALGDESLSEDELRQLLATGEGLALIKGQWVEVDSSMLAEALAHWKKVEAATAQGGISFVEGMRLLAGAPADLGATQIDGEEQSWSFVQPGPWLASLLEELRDPRDLQAATPGKTLKATLRPYQEIGVNWLWLLSRLGLGACLADDMGLGKTIQVIALLLALKKKRPGKPSLLVLPASLLGNWKAELQRFGPSLRTVFVHTSLTDRATIDALAGEGALNGVDVVLTTYGTLVRQQWMLDHLWQLVILDEAQAIKNPAARQTKAVKKLEAASRIALTGTPVENRLGDLWSLFDFLCPGLLGSASRFKGFVKSLSERQTNQYAPLRNLVRPYILRRLKTDKTVISDLPEKIETKVYCGLSRSQAALYQKAVGELAHALKTLSGIQRRGLVLSYLMRFKQICNHPSHLSGDGEYRGKDSGKFLRLAQLCEEIASRQEKILVFTQFREMTDPLASFLAESFGRPGLILHGGTSVAKRKRLVDEYQHEDGPPFFILSLKAGGTGLNLTAASHVVHFDRWWNPAVENQATDRAFRIGQKRNVLVHKFVCQGTVEDRIDGLISDKTALASDILDGGAETMLTEMSNDELLEMVSLDIDRTDMGAG